MYKRISKYDFIYDIKKHSQFSDDIIEFIFDYMEEEYNVQHYEPNVIANKFEIISIDDVRVSKEYTDVILDVTILNLDLDVLGNKKIFEMWGSFKMWKPIKMITEDKCLFDVEYYKEINY